MSPAPTSPGRYRKVLREVATAADGWLLVRMCGWAFALRVLKHVVPLPTLARLAMPTAGAQARHAPAREKVVTLARWSARAVRWSGTGPCLERALVTQRYLASAGYAPVLVIGVAPGEAAAGVSSGHAWVTLDGVPVEPADDALERFVPIASFAHDGTIVDDAGRSGQASAAAESKRSRSSVTKSGSRRNHPA